MGDFSFGRDWPWIGAAAALGMLILLFGTTLLQADPARSRWRDRTWLAWAAMFLYLVHNVEEYGVDAMGRHYEFPSTLAETFPKAVADPPNAFYLAVNLSLFWLAAPLAALLAKRHPLVGLATCSVMAINLLTHVGAFFAAGYNPGLVTAVTLFLPMTAWVAFALFGEGRMSWKGFGVVLFAGVVLHVVLMASIQLLVHGMLPARVAVWVQVLNAALMLFVLWMGERILGERLRA